MARYANAFHANSALNGRFHSVARRRLPAGVVAAILSVHLPNERSTHGRVERVVLHVKHFGEHAPTFSPAIKLEIKPR